MTAFFPLPPCQGLDLQSGISNVKPGFLTVAENVDVTVAGSIHSRAGYRKIWDGPVDAFWTDGKNCLMQSADVLMQVARDGLSWSFTTITSGLLQAGPGNFLQAVEAQDKLYWTTGVEQGVIANGAVRPLGIVEPMPPLLQSTVGTLPAGTYLVAITFLRDDGRESAPSDMAWLDVSEGGVRVDLPVSISPFITDVCVYLSYPNGTDLYWAGSVANGVTSFDVITTGGIDYGRPVPGVESQAPPQAAFFGLFNGRLLLASGGLLYWSQLADFERFDIGESYLDFDGHITGLGTTADALYIATATTTWRFGPGFPTDTQRDRIGNGCIPGTMAMTTINGVDELFWFAPDGVCRAVPGSPASNLTLNTLPPTQAAFGCGVVYQQADEARYLANLALEQQQIFMSATIGGLTSSSSST